MATFTPQDWLYIAGTLALLFVAGFLCWVLYETARLIRQANTMVTDTRNKIDKIEELAIGLMEKFSNVSNYLGFLAEGGKQIFSLVNSRRKKAVKKGKQKLSEIMEEDEEA